MERHPVALTKEEAARLTMDTIELVKRGDCSFYNCCMDQAIKENWPNFGCQSCTAYQAIDSMQKEWDLYQLLMLQAAADNIMDQGNAGRKRGVKPGADAKTAKDRAFTANPPASDPAVEDAPIVSAYPTV